MKALFLIIILGLTICKVNSQPCGELKVTHKGKTYNTVEIGKQCWLKENLNVGTMMEEQLNNLLIEKYCYDDKEVNCDKYGGLYEWGEAMAYKQSEGVRGICPTGWHIPTFDEFEELLKIGRRLGYDALRSTGENRGARDETINKSGFSGITTNYWSSTKLNEVHPEVYVLALGEGYNDIRWFDSDRGKLNACSVRCLRDK